MVEARGRGGCRSLQVAIKKAGTAAHNSSISTTIEKTEQEPIAVVLVADSGGGGDYGGSV